MSDKIFLIDTVSSHRMTYAVKCKSESKARSFVKKEEIINEVSQEHIGENILRVREVSEEEYLALFDKDNDYLKEWTREQKLNLINSPPTSITLSDPILIT